MFTTVTSIEIIDSHMAAVLCEYVRVWDLIEPVQLSPQVADRYIWKVDAKRELLRLLCV
jgi:hypothetical protein